jgi:hypothetical protein
MAGGKNEFRVEAQQALNGFVIPLRSLMFGTNLLNF